MSICSFRGYIFFVGLRIHDAVILSAAKDPDVDYLARAGRSFLARMLGGCGRDIRVVAVM
jgi:hypothetical protein